MSTMISATKLHFNKREITFLVPLYITALVAIISALISIVFWRLGATPGTTDWIESSQYNPGIMWSLAGFLVYLGVQSVATTFPFALTLGTTRRGFTGGTFLWSAAVAAYLTLVFAVLTLLEIATNHWFVGFYIFDVNVIGAGDLSRLIPIVFLGVLTLLTVGGVFGASWMRFGSRGPVFIGAGAGVVLVVALIVVVPSASDILAAFELWWLAVAALVVTALSATGSWLMLRSATVR